MSQKKSKATRRSISILQQDVSQIYASELSRIRGIVPAKLTMFSNANRTRNPEVIEKFFWCVYDKLKTENPGLFERNESAHATRKPRQ